MNSMNNLESATGSRDWKDVCRHVMDYASDAILIADSNGCVIQANRRTCELIERNRHELQGARSIDLVCPADRPRLTNDLSRLEEGIDLLTVVSFPTTDGHEIPVEISATSVYDRDADELLFVAILRDLRTRHAEEQSRLRQHEEQRNAIVREIHHRIKNHLQGLLGLICRESERNPDGAYLFRDISTKVNSIAVVHGLQASQQRDAINLCDLVTTVSALNEEVRGMPGRVTPSVEIPERALIRESECVPVALLMNEAIGNAIKHSRTEDDPVTVNLAGDGREGWATVTIRNAGSLPNGFDETTFSGISSGLGLQRALLPATGAWLSIRNDDSRREVVTVIHFESPVLVKRGPKS